MVSVTEHNGSLRQVSLTSPRTSNTWRNQMQHRILAVFVRLNELNTQFPDLVLNFSTAKLNFNKPSQRVAFTIRSSKLTLRKGMRAVARIMEIVIFLKNQIDVPLLLSFSEEKLKSAL
ncbi:hypothetical protein LOAG_11635 [Loa loa]|uniref:Uncharacterized protein n=1 Tax=Loa loa TaxID=7209 RepID=A0A1S0TP59_LOALO|nr:hypothetical protein LOAG_11635 [Loa loa]EFO16869.1 hypothetical protein LOAG_11635 [Loa loa]